MSSSILFEKYAARKCSEVAELSRLSTSAETVGVLRHAPPGSWILWDPVPCLVLLGEPASGKSRELQYQFEFARTNGRTAFLSLWKNWYVGDDVFETLQDRAAFFSALEAGQEVWWFLDALDEGKVKAETAFDQLQIGLRELRRRGLLHLLRLRLSCRSRDWRRGDCIKLAMQFGASGSGPDAMKGLVTVQLQPLSKEAIRGLIEQKLDTQAAVDRFMQDLSKRNVEVLAAQPLLLGMMLDLYKVSDKPFQGDRCSLYVAGIDKLIEEHNAEHQDRRTRSTLPAMRLKLAQQLAVHSVFGGFDRIGLPDGDPIGGRVLDASCADARPDELRETLSTSLFTGNVASGSSFIHRSFQEFLAARKLSELLEDNLPLSRIRPLFVTANNVIPGALRETAAWLSALHQGFREWLIDIDPLTAAQAETMQFSPAQCERLVMALAEKFSERNWQREIDKFGEVARAVPVAVLASLLSPTMSVAVREMAVAMIASAGVTALYPSLLQIIVDAGENPVVRKRAAGVLCERAPADYVTDLAGLLTLPAVQDPDDEIAGTVLRALYPKLLDTVQVLSGLRIPRTPNLFGAFRQFWEREFLELLPNTQIARHAVLDALLPILPTAEHSFEARSLVEQFARVLTEEVKGATIEIARIGPWLVALSRTRHQVGQSPEPMMDEFIAALNAQPGLRTEILHWRLDTWSKGQAFMPWSDLPFAREGLQRSEFEMWLGVCRKHAADPERTEWCFQQVVNIAMTFLDEDLFSPIDHLCTEFPNFKPAWDANRCTPIDSPTGKAHRELRSARIGRDAQEQAFTASVLAHIDLLRNGHPVVLENVLLNALSDAFGELPLEELRTRYGDDLAEAARQGVAKAWSGLTKTDFLWPVTLNLPNFALVLGMGFLQENPEIVPPRRPLSAPQVEYLIWRCMHQRSELPQLLPYLWTHHRDETWRRIRDRLQAEAMFPEKDYASQWSDLANADQLPDGLASCIMELLLVDGLPRQSNARRKSLLIALYVGGDRVRKIVFDTVSADWDQGAVPQEAEEPAAIAAVAAAWLIDAPNINERLTRILSGPRHRSRAEEFVESIQAIQGSEISFNSRWTSSVAWQDYAVLLPLLYHTSPAPITYSQGGFVSPSQQFGWVRDSLVNHLLKAPPELAEIWFGRWKSDPLFGVHRDWFANVHAEMVRRHADESWTQPSQAALKRVLAGSAALVQNDADFWLLLNETISGSLATSFRSDSSQVPALWGGTKKEGRSPLGEKTLQTIVYGQLTAYLSVQKVVGTREPEQFDAVKPDYCFSKVLDSGVVVDIPIEIKWAGHADLWGAPKGQLMAKYMGSPAVRFGIYIVAWAGKSIQKIKNGPIGSAPDEPVELQRQLQHHVDSELAGSGKAIRVHVLDASVADH